MTSHTQGSTFFIFVKKAMEVREGSENSLLKFVLYKCNPRLFIYLGYWILVTLDCFEDFNAYKVESFIWYNHHYKNHLKDHTTHL